MQNFGNSLFRTSLFMMYSDNINSVLMGSMEVPSQSGDVIKVPTAQYEFGANFIDLPQVCFNDIMTRHFCVTCCISELGS
jgi:hypothetical protein